MPTNYDNEYRRYVDRFTQQVGDFQIGQLGRYRGRLVKKYPRDEFVAKVERYMAMGQRFNAIVSSGDTMDDTLALDLRALEIELVMERSLFLPMQKGKG
jgi:hypothetical protein